jgi:hypothetical protein
VSSYSPERKVPIVFEIEQELTSIHLVCYVRNESSYSIVTSIGKNNHGHWCVYNIYQNINESMLVEDSHVKNHEGVSFANIFENGKILKGRYFSNPRDRGSYGIYELKWVSKARHGGFE